MEVERTLCLKHGWCSSRLVLLLLNSIQLSYHKKNEHRNAFESHRYWIHRTIGRCQSRALEEQIGRENTNDPSRESIKASSYEQQRRRRSKIPALLQLSVLIYCVRNVSLAAISVSSCGLRETCTSSTRSSTSNTLVRTYVLKQHGKQTDRDCTAVVKSCQSPELDS